MASAPENHAAGGAGGDSSSQEAERARRRRNLLIIAIPFVLLTLSAAALVWMLVLSNERAGRGDYDGLEGALEGEAPSRESPSAE